MTIMDEVTHRPWPIISKNWIIRQSWSNLLFTHWPISAELLRPYIPRSLQIDTFDGTAWLGVVVFVMEGIYLRGLSALSLTPKFAEINVRTYVQCNGKPGVYFISLDVGDWASLMIAKRWYRLPYKAAQISFQKEGQTFFCQSLRKGKAKVPIGFQSKYIPDSRVFFQKRKCLTIGSQSAIASLVQIKGAISIAAKFIINRGHYRKLRLKSAGIPFLLHFNLTFLKKHLLHIFQKVWILSFGILRD